MTPLTQIILEVSEVGKSITVIRKVPSKERFDSHMLGELRVVCFAM